MGGFYVDGLSALATSLDQLAAIPDNVLDTMLREGAEVLVQAQRESAEAYGLRDTGMMIDSIKAGKARRNPDGGDIGIAPEGTRRRGNTTTRNAEIAYVNEYGKEGQPGTGFISKANFEHGPDAIEASDKVYQNWLDRIGL